MLRTLAYALLTIPCLALRQMVVIGMMLCLMLGPFSSAMATHHANDVDASIAMGGDASDLSAENKAADHVPSLPEADHDCHGCTIAMVHAPANVLLFRVATNVGVTSEPFVIGQAPSAELRPPRA